MICATAGTHHGPRSVFCFSYPTTCHYHHHAELPTCVKHIQWKIQGSVDYCWVYSAQSVFEMKLIPSISFAAYGAVCVHLTDSSLKDREDIFIFLTDRNIIHQSGSSTISIVVTVCNYILFIDIYPAQTGFCFHYSLVYHFANNKI